MTRTTALTLALLAMDASRVGAGPPSGGGPDRLISRALQLRRAGRPTDALDLFRKAHEEAPSPRTLGHLGLVETSLQLWSDADAHLAAALATPDNRWVRQNRLFLAEARARAETHVGQLTVSGPPGARLSVAGKEVGRLPLAAPLRLAEGSVRVTATAEGRKPFSVQFDIQGGTRAAIIVVLDPVNLQAPSLVVPPPAPTPEAPRRLDRGRWAGTALLGGGAGALALGIAWLEMDGRCETGTVRPRRCLSAYDTAGLGWAATAGGAAMLVAGGIVLYAGSRRAGAAGVGVAAGPRSVRLEARF